MTNLSFYFECSQTLVTPATESIFPLVESYLAEGDHQKAFRTLEQVTAFDDAGRYLDRIDWLLCSVFPEERESCQKWYRGEGEQLRYIISDARRRFYELVLVGVCKRCYQLSQQAPCWQAEAAELAAAVLVEATIEAVSKGALPGARTAKKEVLS